MTDDYIYWVICKNDKPKKYYQNQPNNDVWAKLVLSNMDGRHSFGQGDAMIVRDELQAAGFKWGKDFYLKKVEVKGN